MLAYTSFVKFASSCAWTLLSSSLFHETQAIRRSAAAKDFFEAM